MSKRRTVGEVVWKRENAGFVGEPGLVKIVDDYEPDYCMFDCGDPECREWNTLHECDKDGKPLGGVACHVSECQMEDPPETTLDNRPPAI